MAADAPFGHCPQCLIALGFASKPSELPPGSEFVRRSGNGLGDYELISQIGRGGMGVVFRAQQKSLGRIVALKMIRDEQVVSPVFLKRFQIEAEAAASLDHPHIVPIYEVGEEEGQHFYSMRLMEGGSLEERITPDGFVPRHNGSIGERARQEQIAKLVARAARAVHHAHRKGVVHRDLKPSNILLDEDGHPHLSDFGIAKLRDGHAKLTITGALLGTPSYMSPEQAQGETHLLSPAADIYSLGAILYEMLTGKPPFSGITPVETLHRLTSEDPKRPTTLNPAVDRDLENICLKCLEKSPGQRYISAEALAEDLERWLRHEPIRAKRAGLVARLQRWVRRNPVGAALIATLLLGLSATLALLQMITTARDTAEQQRGLMTTDAEMEAFWGRSSSSSSLEWRSEKLRAIVNLPSRPPLAPGGPRYRMGILVEEKPKDRLHGYATFLAYLEEKLDPRSNRLDFVTYKRNEIAIKDLVKGDLDFLRIGGLSYLDAKSSSPAITAIVAQAPAKTGVIFTRTDSPIETLPDLKGRSFAFGDPYATISFWAKYHLAQAGVSGADLKYEIFNSIDAFERNIRKGTPDLGPGERLNSHTEVIKKVMAGEYDAGVASARQIRELLEKHQVKKLAEFRSTSLFWLARGDLPQDLVQRLQRAMRELDDKKLLEAVGGQNTRFEPVSTKELEELERATEIVKKNFPPPSSLGLPDGAQKERK